MKSRKKENTINENIDLQPHTLTDLPVTGGQADETKGGADEPIGFTPAGRAIVVTVKGTN